MSGRWPPPAIPPKMPPRYYRLSTKSRWGAETNFLYRLWDLVLVPLIVFAIAIGIALFLLYLT